VPESWTVSGRKTRDRLIRITISIAIVIVIENKNSKFDENFSIKVCLKKFNQSLVVKS